MTSSFDNYPNRMVCWKDISNRATSAVNRLEEFVTELTTVSVR